MTGRPIYLTKSQVLKSENNAICLNDKKEIMKNNNAIVFIPLQRV